MGLAVFNYRLGNAFNDMVEGIDDFAGATYRAVISTEDGGQLKAIKVASASFKLSKKVCDGLSAHVSTIARELGSTGGILSGLDLAVQIKYLKNTSLEYVSKTITLISGLALSIIGFGRYLEDLKLINVFGKVIEAIGKIPYIGLLPLDFYGLIPTIADLWWKAQTLAQRNQAGLTFARQKIEQIDISDTIASMWKIQKEVCDRLQVSEHFAQETFNKAEAEYERNRIKLLRLSGRDLPVGQEEPQISPEQQIVFNATYNANNSRDIDALIQRPANQCFAAIRDTYRGLNQAVSRDNMKHTLDFEARKWSVLTKNEKIELTKPWYSIAVDIIKIVSITLTCLTLVYVESVVLAYSALTLALIAAAAGICKVIIGEYKEGSNFTPDAQVTGYLRNVANPQPAPPAPPAN